ncbi:hypothetical protein [Streptomyces sp. NPDC002763]
MNDAPSRLDLLLFARRVVEQQALTSLAQLDRWTGGSARKDAGMPSDGM